MPYPVYAPGTTVRLLPDAETDDLTDPDVQKETRRPYVLLTPSGPGIDCVTLAYCSTKDTQKKLGGAHVVVEPRSTLFHMTGFHSKTYVYPSRLVQAQPKDLVHHGRLIDEFPRLHDRELPRALGYGTGTYETGPAKLSWRGVIVDIDGGGEEGTTTSHAIVVSDPEYSKQGEFFNVVPMYPADQIRAIEPDMVFPGSLPWVAQLGWSSAAVLVTLIFTLYRDDDVIGNRAVPVDAASMDRVDQALRQWFDGTEW